MRLVHSICMGMAAVSFCAVLIACRSSRVTPYAAENPYLTHYLDAVSDSTENAGKRKQSADPAENLNKYRMHEEVNPEKEGTWGDFLRNLLKYYWLNGK